MWCHSHSNVLTISIYKCLVLDDYTVENDALHAALYVNYIDTIVSLTFLFRAEYFAIYCATLNIYCMCCLILIVLWHRKRISNRKRQVVFLCWMQDNHQQNEFPLTNRLSYRRSSQKLERPYHKWAFSPLDFTIGIGSPLAVAMLSQIARFMEPTWGPPGSCRPHVGSMNLAIRDVNIIVSLTFPNFAEYRTKYCTMLNVYCLKLDLCLILQHDEIHLKTRISFNSVYHKTYRLLP